MRSLRKRGKGFRGSREDAAGRWGCQEERKRGVAGEPLSVPGWPDSGELLPALRSPRLGFASPQTRPLLELPRSPVITPRTPPASRPASPRAAWQVRPGRDPATTVRLRPRTEAPRGLPPGELPPFQAPPPAPPPDREAAARSTLDVFRFHNIPAPRADGARPDLASCVASPTGESLPLPAPSCNGATPGHRRHRLQDRDSPQRVTWLPHGRLRVRMRTPQGWASRPGPVRRNPALPRMRQAKPEVPRFWPFGSRPGFV